MERLTVSEAAERLGISEGAVRKRVQRGTLAHGKRPDGRVYVVMDTNMTVEEDADTENPDGDNQNTQRSWWDYAAGVSALVVVFGGLIYALGLFVLFAPIAMTYTHDLSAAWHATFLVPRAIVAGLGVWRLVAFPLFAATLIFAVCYVAIRFALKLSLRFPERWVAGVFWIVTSFPVLLIVGYASWVIATGPSPLAQAPYLTIVVLVLALIGVPALTAFLIFVLYRGNLQKYRADVFAAVVGLIFMVFIAYQDWHSGILPSVPGLGEPSVSRNALIQAALVVGAGTTVAVAAVRATSNILNLVAESEDRYWIILLSFLTVSAAAVIAAVMLTIPSNPPLPKVIIDVKEKKENTTGRLLTHAEGFWYIFEEDGQPGKRLTAIPDDGVTSAWVSKVPAR